MNKLLGILAVFAVIAFAGLAFAEDTPSDGTPGENRGMQECKLFADGSTHDNPGELLTYIREHETIAAYEGGGSIVEWLAQFPGYTGSPGDWIIRNCSTEY